MIELSKTIKEDLETLFVIQTNRDGIQMAAFTSEDPSDKEAYLKKWSKLVKDPNIKMQTIRVGDKIAGSIAHFEMLSETNVTYWIDREYWGKGIATNALKFFIVGVVKRPLFARVAYDNYGSQRVLEKCGFQLIGEEKGFANARGKEIVEFVYRFG